MINFQYVRANNAKSAIAAAAKDKNSKFIAGGTNLIDLMKRGVSSPEKLIDINLVPLKQIEMIKDVIYIGSMATNADVADHQLIKSHFPALGMALNAGASPQLRNVATVGGNIMQRTRCGYFYDTEMPCNKRQPGSGCGAIQGYSRMHAIFGASESCIAVHPSDMCVGLSILDTTIVLAGPKGERKMKFTEFHKLPGNTPEKDNNLLANEMIIRLEIPVDDLNQRSSYIKVRDRASYAFALISVASTLMVKADKITEARIAMGGVAHKPWRLTEAEAFLVGKAPSLEVFEQAAALAVKSARTYKDNGFKVKLATNTIVESLKSIS
ncbi:FAD binding domain-containing protein [Pedobacter sp. JCM 36344]|uniref:FAD binding domain-containing protein n=1 Tax=Pedobacter sp. JCM 36344 TaxID=3374280 RepID=UPI00397D19D8